MSDIEEIYDRVRAGELVPVRTRPIKSVSGVEIPVRRFKVQGEWFYGVCWYSAILRNGRRDKHHNRLLLSTDVARDWFSHLELDTEEESHA
jgi:hypothetical protein